MYYYTFLQRFKTVIPAIDTTDIIDNTLDKDDVNPIVLFKNKIEHEMVKYEHRKYLERVQSETKNRIFKIYKIEISSIDTNNIEIVEEKTTTRLQLKRDITREECVEIQQDYTIPKCYNDLKWLKDEKEEYVCIYPDIYKNITCLECASVIILINIIMGIGEPYLVIKLLQLYPLTEEIIKENMNTLHDIFWNFAYTTKYDVNAELYYKKAMKYINTFKEIK